MPVTWNTTVIDGVNYLVMDVTKFRVPLDWDPSSGMFFAVAVPDGGVGSLPVLAQGEDGVTPDIDTVVNFTALEYGDPTADSASFTETSPNVYKLNLSLHKGSPGAPGDTVLDPTDFGTPVAKKIIVVNNAASGFVYQTQKVGDTFWPASISNTPSGNTSFTLCSVAVPAQDFDWRPCVAGQCIVTGTGSNVRVDLIARLNNATSGNIVGRGFDSAELSSTTHVHPTVRLSSGPPAGSVDGYNRVAAGASATVYLRAECQAGSTDTFTTSNATTMFSVRVDPVP